MDLAGGMARLVGDGVVQSSLRMVRGFHETPCLPGYSSIRCRSTIASTSRLSGCLCVPDARLASKIPLLSARSAKKSETVFLLARSGRWTRRMVSPSCSVPSPTELPSVFLPPRNGTAIGRQSTSTSCYPDETIAAGHPKRSINSPAPSTLVPSALGIVIDFEWAVTPLSVVGEPRGELPESVLRAGCARRPWEVLRIYVPPLSANWRISTHRLSDWREHGGPHRSGRQG